MRPRFPHQHAVQMWEGRCDDGSMHGRYSPTNRDPCGDTDNGVWPMGMGTPLHGCVPLEIWAPLSGKCSKTSITARPKSFCIHGLERMMVVPNKGGSWEGHTHESPPISKGKGAGGFPQWERGTILWSIAAAAPAVASDWIDIHAKYSCRSFESSAFIA